MKSLMTLYQTTRTITYLKILSSNRFPWYISRKVVHGNNALWNSQYYHTLYRNENNYKSEYYSLVESIMKKA